MLFLLLIYFYISNSAVSGKKYNSDDVLSRVIFGTHAPLTEYPFFARIENSGQHFCGAAIISDRWLLTAAHCISSENVYIVGGDKNDNSYKIVADMVVKHPYYVHNYIILDNDIALVRLASRLQFSDKVQFITLPTSDEVKGPLLSLGRGINEFGFLPPRLMKVDIMEVDISLCRVGPFSKNHFICATRSPIYYANVCGGDSGSPLVSYGDSNATLVGITSFITNPNCLHNIYSAFVRVSHYMPWIQVVMNLYSV